MTQVGLKLPEKAKDILKRQDVGEVAPVDPKAEGPAGIHGTIREATKDGLSLGKLVKEPWIIDQPPCSSGSF